MSKCTKGLRAGTHLFILACHVRRIKLFNHASPEKMSWTTRSTRPHCKICESHTQMSKPASQMLFDSVRSLVMCNLFSHALFWSAWPRASSGFSFTLNMSEAEVKLRTMTDTNTLTYILSLQLPSSGHFCLLLDDSQAVSSPLNSRNSNQDGSRLSLCGFRLSR